MKRLLALTLFLLAMFLLAPILTPAHGASIFPYRYDKKVLPNGLTVILIPLDSPGLVAYYSIVRTGSRDEVVPGRSGFAHFFEHMMFRGTQKYPGPVYDRIVTAMGAKANAYTTDDYTAFHLNFAREDLPRVMEIESDRFQNLHYEKPAFQTEAGAVYGEYRKGITQPFILLNEKVQDLAYDVHPYKHTTMGFEADIKTMPEAYDFSRAFFRRFYRPENVVLLIAGDIDPVATLALAARHYGPWKPGYQPSQIPAEPPQRAPRQGEVAYPGRTLPILSISYKADAFDPDNRLYVAADLLAELAFGPNSRLYNKLVLDEQKVQVLGAEAPMNRDPSLLGVTAMVKKESDLDYVRQEIYRTIDRFQTQPVEQEKLDQLKRRNKYAFLMSLDTPEHVAGGLARFVALSGGIEIVDRYYAALERVTPEDIREAARKYLVPQRRTVVVLKGARS
jgi:zinc protease